MGALLGALVLWGGYTFVTYGWSQVRGCNSGLRDLAWPDRYTGCHPDAAADTGTPGSSGSAIPLNPPGPKGSLGGFKTKAACEKAIGGRAGLRCVKNVDGLWSITEPQASR